MRTSGTLAVLVLLASASPAPAALAPEGVKAKPLDSAAELKWQAEDDTEGYFVYLSEDGQTFDKVNTKATRKSSFVVDGLSGGTRYYFYVTSTGRKGSESKPSETVSVTLAAGTAAAPPPPAAPPLPADAPPAAAAPAHAAAAPPATEAKPAGMQFKASVGAGGAAPSDGSATLFVQVIKTESKRLKAILDDEELGRLSAGTKEFKGLKAGRHELRIKEGIKTVWKGELDLSANGARTAVVSVPEEGPSEVKLQDGPPAGP